jgi:hypothetical protein
VVMYWRADTRGVRPISWCLDILQPFN